MNEKIKNYLGIAGTSSLVMLTILLIVGTYVIYTFSRSIDPSQYRSFTVSAEGEVKTAPDVAQFSFTVITEGSKDIEKLQKENSQKANGIIALIKDTGVLSEDIKTTNYSVTPRYLNYRCNFAKAEPCPPSEIVGYTIRTSVSVKVRDFETIGTILAGVAKKGANTISGPYFTIDNLEKAQSEAREQAIEKARTKAEDMAKAGGFRLGKLLSINEGGGYYPRAMQAKAISEDKFGAGGGVEAPIIEPGSQDVKISVTLQFQIK